MRGIVIVVLSVALFGCDRRESLRKHEERLATEAAREAREEAQHRAREKDEGAKEVVSAGQAAPSAGRKRCRWLILNHRTYEHVVHVDVHGKRYASFEKQGSGFEVKPSPFRDGANAMVVTFVPRERDAPRLGSRLQVLLSPTTIPGEEPLPGFECEIDEGHCEYGVEIEMEGGVPGQLRFTRRDWLDADRKALVYEERVETDIFSEEYDDMRTRSWDGDGSLRDESHSSGGKLVAAKRYGPDGKLGCEVKEGTGVLREWYEDGALALETPIAGGVASGVAKEYYEDGRLLRTVTWKDDVPSGEAVMYDEVGNARMRGAFVDGEKHGTWMRYDKTGRETARSVFRNGELVEGDDLFQDFEEP